MTRARSEIDAVLALLASGLNDCAVARMTGIPRSTVRGWRKGRLPSRPGLGELDGTCQCRCDSRPGESYAYLLGLYLGDGCISRMGRTWRLRIVLDARYPGIIAACADAMETVFPEKRAARVKRPGAIEVSMYSNHWPCWFPQHGPGKKHDRPIVLELWQADLVDAHVESFVRGLIHSDGCRVVANDRGRASIRYHFSNRSDDIKKLFCGALDMLGIPWTRPSERDIAVYRQAAVAMLDRFIGPKS